jgi:hypothetical protein
MAREQPAQLDGGRKLAVRIAAASASETMNITETWQEGAGDGKHSGAALFRITVMVIAGDGCQFATLI